MPLGSDDTYGGEWNGLFRVGEGFDLGFEGLVVLALDLQFGLELFHQEFEARDFDAKLVRIGAGGTRRRAR